MGLKHSIKPLRSGDQWWSELRHCKIYYKLAFSRGGGESSVRSPVGAVSLLASRTGVHAGARGGSGAFQGVSTPYS